MNIRRMTAAGLLIVGGLGMAGFGFKAMQAASNLVLTGNLAGALAWTAAFTVSAAAVVAGILQDCANTLQDCLGIPD